MGDENPPTADAPQQTGLSNASSEEPFVYPTIGTERVIEKDAGRSRVETRGISEDHRRG